MPGNRARKVPVGYGGTPEIAFSAINLPSPSLLRPIFKFLPWVLCCSVADYLAGNDSARALGAFC
jgi:hypothetical protein